MRRPWWLLRCVRWAVPLNEGKRGVVSRGAACPDWTDPVVELLSFHPHLGRLPERPMGVDCKSIAKASKVRILHLPPRAQRAPDLRKRRLGAFLYTWLGYRKRARLGHLQCVGRGSVTCANAFDGRQADSWRDSSHRSNSVRRIRRAPFGSLKHGGPSSPRASRRTWTARRPARRKPRRR